MFDFSVSENDTLWGRGGIVYIRMKNKQIIGWPMAGWVTRVVEQLGIQEKDK
jgi:hypothetical protein